MRRRVTTRALGKQSCITLSPRDPRPAVWKPTREEVDAARGKRVPDVIGKGLRVLFCGINPSLYSAAVGHHFARPGNRFWPALHRSGFTDRRLSPFEDRSLLEHRVGLTNIADHATARADEISPPELAAGARRLRRKLNRHRPVCVAFLGITAYRQAFAPDAVLGRQEKRVGDTTVWVLPNPSGLNAHYQICELAGLFRELLRAVSENER